jgi:hypothetical protein
MVVYQDDPAEAIDTDIKWYFRTLPRGAKWKGDINDMSVETNTLEVYAVSYGGFYLLEGDKNSAAKAPLTVRSYTLKLPAETMPVGTSLLTVITGTGQVLDYVITRQHAAEYEDGYETMPAAPVTP